MVDVVPFQKCQDKEVDGEVLAEAERVRDDLTELAERKDADAFADRMTLELTRLGASEEELKQVKIIRRQFNSTNPGWVQYGKDLAAWIYAIRVNIKCLTKS